MCASNCCGNMPEKNTTVRLFCDISCATLAIDRQEGWVVLIWWDDTYHLIGEDVSVEQDGTGDPPSLRGRAQMVDFPEPGVPVTMRSGGRAKGRSSPHRGQRRTGPCAGSWAKSRPAPQASQVNGTSGDRSQLAEEGSTGSASVEPSWAASPL